VGRRRRRTHRAARAFVLPGRHRARPRPASCAGARGPSAPPTELMNLPAGSDDPELETLCALFPSADSLASFTHVHAAEVPPPYHALLVHEHHMTVTVEAHHGDLVDV